MSFDLRVPSSLILHMPDLDLQLEALYTDSLSFYSGIEIDYLGSVSNFPKLDTLELKKLLIAFIKDKKVNEEENHNLSKELGLGFENQLICCSEEDSYQSILILMPCINQYFTVRYESYDYVMLKFQLPDLIGNSIDSYISHIENIRFSVAQIKKNCQESDKQKKEIDEEYKVLTNKLENTTKSNTSVSLDLNREKKKIVDLYKKFQALELEEAQCGINLRCENCKNSLKSIVYKPCGHVVVCELCLNLNLKTESNALIKRKRNCLYCQVCKIRVTETRKIIF
jgi:hypothetical protein